MKKVRLKIVVNYTDSIVLYLGQQYFFGLLTKFTKFGTYTNYAQLNNSIKTIIEHD